VQLTLTATNVSIPGAYLHSHPGGARHATGGHRGHGLTSERSPPTRRKGPPNDDRRRSRLCARRPRLARRPDRLSGPARRRLAPARAKFASARWHSSANETSTALARRRPGRRPDLAQPGQPRARRVGPRRPWRERGRGERRRRGLTIPRSESDGRTAFAREATEPRPCSMLETVPRTAQTAPPFRPCGRARRAARSTGRSPG